MRARATRRREVLSGFVSSLWPRQSSSPQLTPGMQSESAVLDWNASAQKIRSGLNNSQELREACREAFVGGSVAAAEAAVAALWEAPPSQVADAIVSLPAAVPNRNADALASLIARLAVRAEKGAAHALAAPLSSCAYADACVRGAAVRSVLSECDAVAAEFSTASTDAEERFSRCLGNVAVFVETIVLGRGTEAFLLVHGLAKLARRRGGTVASQIVQLCSNAALVGAARGLEDTQGQKTTGSDDLEHFIFGELSLLLVDAESASTLTRVCLVRCMETGNPNHMGTLLLSSRARVEKALQELGICECLAALFTLALLNAHAGAISRVRAALEIANSIASVAERLSSGIDAFTVALAELSIVTTEALSKASMDDHAASAVPVGLLDSVARLGALAMHNRSAGGLESLRSTAILTKASEASAILAVLSKLREVWTNAPVAKQWLETDVVELADGLPEAGSGKAPSASFAVGLSNRGSDSDEDDETAGHHEPSPLCTWSHGRLPGLVAIASHAGLWHESAEVRKAALQAIRHIQPRGSTFLFLPALLNRLAAEPTGHVACAILHDGLAGSSMIRERDTGRAVVRVLLHALGSDLHDATGGPLKEACLSALAKITSRNPGLGLRALLSFLEPVSSHFDEYELAVVVMSVAASLVVILERPSRGQNFIPLMQKCLRSDFAAKCPQATSLAFEGMRHMVDEGILDASKTLRIVRKEFKDPRALARPARRSFIALLGAASACGQTPKARSICASCLSTLRDVVLSCGPFDSCPSLDSREDAKQAEQKLGVDEFAEAVASLLKFDVDDVLRIQHHHVQPLDDAEAESSRLQAIEVEVEEFVADLAIVYGKVRAQVGTRCPSQVVTDLQQLLEKVAAHEWGTRSRGQFDPGRLSRMRAASEALRRARQKAQPPAQNGESTSASEFSEAHGEFTRGIKSLPRGALKAFAECVGSGLNDAGANSIQEHAGVACANALVEAKAVFAGLPWARLCYTVLTSSGCSVDVRCAMTRALFSMDNGDYDVHDVRNKLFGLQRVVGGISDLAGGCSPGEVERLAIEIGVNLLESSNVEGFSTITKDDFPLAATLGIIERRPKIDVEDKAMYSYMARATLDQVKKHLQNSDGEEANQTVRGLERATAALGAWFGAIFSDDDRTIREMLCGSEPFLPEFVLYTMSALHTSCDSVVLELVRLFLSTDRSKWTTGLEGSALHGTAPAIAHALEERLCSAVSGLGTPARRSAFLESVKCIQLHIAADGRGESRLDRAQRLVIPMRIALAGARAHVVSRVDVESSGLDANALFARLQEDTQALAGAIALFNGTDDARVKLQVCQLCVALERFFAELRAD